MSNLSPRALALSQAHGPLPIDWERVAAVVEGMLPRGSGRRWRHLKRGTVYTEVCRAQIQIATVDVVEGSDMVVYRGEDGRLWAREEGEFEDGRFEEVTAPADPDPCP